MKLREIGRSKSDGASEDREAQPWSPAETFIDRGCELVGELHFAEDVRIDGKVEGRIRAAKAVIIGESAEIQASIEAATLEVYGAVDGDVKVVRGTTLHKSARVTAEIQTAGIVIEEGAKFKGCIVIGAEESSAEQSRPTTPALKSGDPQSSESKEAGATAVA